MSEDKDLEERAAEAKAKLDAMAKARAAREKPPGLQEIEDLERQVAEEEAIERAEAEHGDADAGIKVVRFEHAGRAGIVIVRRPDYVKVKQFHDNGDFKLEAKDKFGRPYVVHPSAEKYAELSRENVALVSAVCDAVAWLGGFSRTKLDTK